MKNLFSKWILIFIAPILLTACEPCDCTPFPTLVTEAVAPMETISVLQTDCAEGKQTEAVLGETATVAAYTPTFTDTPIPPPTKTFIPTPRIRPDTEEIIKLLNKSIKDELTEAFHIGRTIKSVEFTPDSGEQRYINFIVTMECAGGEDAYCLSTQAFVDLINACKDSHEVDLFIPDYIQIMQLWISQPNSDETSRVFFDVDWRDVQNYVNGKTSAEEFENKVRSFTIPEMSAP